MKGKILRVKDVDQDTVVNMYKLFLQQFEDISLQDFKRDLTQKNWLLLLSLDDGALAGFSSMHVYQATVADRSMLVAFSGDTVVDASTWRDSALSYYWMGAIDYLSKPADADDVYAALMAPPDTKAQPPENPMSADRVRWEHIQRVFELCNHNVSETARRLNMHRRTLQRKLQKRPVRK